MKKILNLFLFFIIFVLLRPGLYPHCEVPCGIYNDELRFTMIDEHIQTIEKAIQQIMQLSEEQPQNMNQIVRWVVNKEKHAEEIQHIISQYFLTQRIKGPDTEDKQAMANYAQKLILCHQILTHAMKSKQAVDLASVKMLKSAVEGFKSLYFADKK
jgi:nickel superoxide dismutase